MEWIRFLDELPTEKENEQVKILFSNPKWSAVIIGMYEHNEETPFKERISYYDFKTDAFIEWNSMIPTHWMKCPEKPNKTI